MATPALAGLRILDLTSGAAAICGKLLADLGADVVRVEPPRGDIARTWPPLTKLASGDSISLAHEYFNTNKRGVTLDLANSKDYMRFALLVKSADVVIEDLSQRECRQLRLTFRDLRKFNQNIIVASVTGLGREGPYQDYKAPDAVCQSLAGLVYTYGDPRKAPLIAPGDQAYQMAAVTAVYGVLVALFARLRGGGGQHVEASAQDVLASIWYLIVNYSANGMVLRRLGSKRPFGGAAPMGVYRCRDGYVYTFIITPSHWKRLFKWMGSPEALNDPVWENRHFRTQNSDVIDPIMTEFLSGLTRSEAVKQAQERGIPVAPLLSPREFVHDEHVRSTGYFGDTPQSGAGDIPFPRNPLLFSMTPCVAPSRASSLGEYNGEVLRDDFAWLTTPSSFAARARKKGQSRRALQGLRVVDLTLAIAGPTAAKVLAEMGAEVIRVESETHQQRGKFKAGMDPEVELQQRVTYADSNRNKKSVTLNLSTQEGLHILYDLIKKADVLVTNVSPRVLERWGLEYGKLQQLNRDLVALNISGFGMSGPYKYYLSGAPTSAAMTGMYNLWTYTDGAPPVGTPVQHPDYFTGIYGAVGVMAALVRKAQTRDETDRVRGQGIDLSQLEATASLLGPFYLDCLVNKTDPGAMGDLDLRAAPFGCYPCAGDDRWCTITVRTLDEWRALCSAIDHPEWEGDERFQTVASRRQHRAEIDQALAAWTSRHSPQQAMRRLQRAGVPAGAVNNAEDLYFDVNLRERGYFAPVHTQETGVIEYPGPVVHLSRTPGRVGRCADMGQHNRQVFQRLLGLTSAKVAKLEKKGVFV